VQQFRELGTYTSLKSEWRELLSNGTCSPSSSYVIGFSSGASLALLSKLDDCEDGPWVVLFSLRA
jgi:hypothetical protein